MTWLLRKIDHVDPWLDLDEAEDLEAVAAAPPLWAVRLFIPSHKDNGSLSCYEVEDKHGAQLVAAAFGMHLELDRTKISFVAAKKELVVSGGFEVRKYRGSLCHEIDESHVGIENLDVEKVKLLTGLFIAGERFYFEKSVVGTTVRNEVRGNRFDFSQLAKFNAPPINKTLIKFVGDELVTVIGKPLT